MIFWNAFELQDGECLNDRVRPHYFGLFDQDSAATPEGSVMLPFPIWREAYVNDAGLAVAVVLVLTPAGCDTASRSISK